MILYEPFKTRPLSDFRAELHFEYPELPDQLWDYYLVKVAIDMAKRGNFVRRRIALQAQPCVTRYQLKSPDGLDICGILGIRHATCGHCHTHKVHRTFDPPEYSACCSKEVAWYDIYENVFHIHHDHCAGMYYITVAVAPEMGACELPVVFYDELLQPLLYGVKGQVLMLAGKSWTNLQLGKAYTDEYRNSIGQYAQDFLTRKQRGIVHMNFGKVM